MSSSSDISKIIDSNYGSRIRTRICGVLIEDDRILLAKHQGVGDEGIFYIPPGGGLEFGETIADCLKREFQEETNLTVDVIKLLDIHEFISDPLHAVELFYQVKRTGGELKTGSDPELKNIQIIQETRFFSLSELSQIPQKQLHPILRTITNFEQLR